LTDRRNPKRLLREKFFALAQLKHAQPDATLQGSPSQHTNLIRFDGWPGRDTFDMYAEEARKMGLPHAASGPLVCSLYHADEQAHAAGVS
jgi:lipoate synthase